MTTQVTASLHINIQNFFINKGKQLSTDLFKHGVGIKFKQTLICALIAK